MPFFQLPPPLLTAPSLRIWRRFARQSYLVFVDESFFQFFDYRRCDGNFCHGAFGIPADEYDAFQARFSATTGECLNEIENISGQKQSELKHTQLYKLPLSSRERFAVDLCEAILAHGGFIAGFHTSNKGFLMEKLREDAVTQEENVLSIPDDHTTLVQQKIAQLNAEHVGPGKSELISRLLLTPIAAITNFLSSFECHFTLIYDPRGRSEDTAVKAQAEDYMKLLSEPHVREFLDISAGGTGFDASRLSHQEFGLQIADIVAGEVRRFFRVNHELLTVGSSLTLVTGHSVEEFESAMPIDGVLIKTGRYVKTPAQLQKKYLTPNDDVFLPYLLNAIMSGSLCCFTEFGQERMVMLFQGYVHDVCD